MADDEQQKKQAELEAKKAEVRRRLEEAGQAGKKKKKGFLTPERKKKLRKLLMSKAAEDLKRQQLVKEQERQKILAQRIIALPNVDSVEDKGQLEKIYNDLFTRLCQLEEEKYDINFQVSGKESEINTLTISVNDLRGKFVKPSLKKVSKYDNKFKKAAAKEGEEPAAGFAVNLKKTKKEGNVIDEIMNKKKGMKDGKPDWSKKDKKEENADAAAAAAPAPEQEEIEVPKADEPVEEAPAEEEEEEGEEEEEEEEE